MHNGCPFSLDAAFSTGSSRLHKNALCFLDNLTLVHEKSYYYIQIYNSYHEKKIYLSNIRLKFIISTTNLAENLAICVSAERFGSGGNTIPGLELTGNADWLQRYIS